MRSAIWEVRLNGVVVGESALNALVALHKEQFGRGPTRARTEWAGRDAMVCFLEDALLPAEQQMVRIGAAQRVREQRAYFQAITATHFIGAVEKGGGTPYLNRAFESAVTQQVEQTHDRREREDREHDHHAR